MVIRCPGGSDRTPANRVRGGTGDQNMNVSPIACVSSRRSTAFWVKSALTSDAKNNRPLASV